MDIKEKIKLIDGLNKELSEIKSTDNKVTEALERQFEAEFTYNSNAIEGSTLSLIETKIILQDGLSVPGKSMREHYEAINHRDAIRHIKTLSFPAPYIISEEELLNLHRTILNKIDYEWAGKYRQQPVFIKLSNQKVYEYCNYEEVPGRVRELLLWLRESVGKLHPFLLASELHYRFITIHPFIDGNGRTARLLMNLILIQNGYPMVDIKAEKRRDYIAAIETAREKDDMTDFYNLMADALIDSLILHKETYEKRIIWK